MVAVYVGKRARATDPTRSLSSASGRQLYPAMLSSSGSRAASCNQSRRRWLGWAPLFPRRRLVVFASHLPAEYVCESGLRLRDGWSGLIQRVLELNPPNAAPIIHPRAQLGGLARKEKVHRLLLLDALLRRGVGADGSNGGGVTVGPWRRRRRPRTRASPNAAAHPRHLPLHWPALPRTAAPTRDGDGPRGATCMDGGFRGVGRATPRDHMAKRENPMWSSRGRGPERARGPGSTAAGPPARRPRGGARPPASRCVGGFAGAACVRDAGGVGAR